METKPLVFGIIGFILGGLLVSVAATTFDKSEVIGNDKTMSQMTDQLRNKRSDSYDEAFIDNMIIHHQAAVDMAKLSEERAKHNEIKLLSNDIINAQEKEINEMKAWQHSWGYSSMQMH